MIQRKVVEFFLICLCKSGEYVFGFNVGNFLLLECGINGDLYGDRFFRRWGICCGVWEIL